MSIAKSLEKTVLKMRELRLRNNGDLDLFFDPLFEALIIDIDRVKGLETLPFVTGLVEVEQGGSTL